MMSDYTIGDTCPVCGWPLMAEVSGGCVPGNCAMPTTATAVITGMREPDEEIERLMLDIQAIAFIIRHRDQEYSERRVREFARRLLRERQVAINGALDEVIANLQAGGSGGVEMVRAMRAKGR